MISVQLIAMDELENNKIIEIKEKIMKIKLGNILEINNVLKSIIDNTELKIDALFKFRLLGIMKNLEVPIANFHVIRDEKIKEYGKETEDENGNKSIGISVDDKDAIANFSDDINKVIESEVDVNIEKLKAIDVFDKGLPTEYLVKLYPIIEE